MSKPYPYETLLVDIDNGVAKITLNRPEARNAFNRLMSHEFGHALAVLEEDEAVRVMVVTGAGRVFCAGAELSSGGGLGAGEAGPIEGRPPSADVYPWTFSTPIIGAINGSAVGLGLTYPMMWDIRIVARDAKLGFVFTRRGLIPEGNASWLLSRLVGAARALELLITGRMFSGTDAEAWGLATQAVEAEDVLPTAMALARDIADNTAPAAVAVTKKLFYRYLEDGGDRLHARREELEAFHWSLAQPDAKEGIDAFLEKRLPKWKSSKRNQLPVDL